MEVFKCPHCGEPLEETIGDMGSEFFCSICGPVHFLEDSREIIISEGEMDGPGLSRLEESMPDLLITKGEMLKPGQAEKEYEGLDIDKRSQPEPELEPYKEEEMDDFLYEEEISAEYEEAFGNQEEEPPAPSPEKKKRARKGRRPSTAIEPSPVAQEEPFHGQRITTTQRKTVPSHMTFLFYAIPLVLILGIAGLYGYRYFAGQSNNTQAFYMPPERARQWDHACQLAQQAWQLRMQALKFKNQSSQQKVYFTKLQKAYDLYQQAQKEGQMAWQAFVAHQWHKAALQNPKITKAEVDQQCQKQASPDLDKRQEWRHNLNKIDLASLKSILQSPQARRYLSGHK